MSDATVPEPMDEAVLSAYLDGEIDLATRVAVLQRLREAKEWRDVLEEVRAVRDAVRQLETHEAPAGFWDRVLAETPDELPDAADWDAEEWDEPDDEPEEWDEPAAVPSLAARRRLRAPRWAALVASAAAAVMLVLVVLPSRDQTRPPVATFTDAHAARSSLTDDAVSQLAGVTRTPQVP